MLYVGERLGTHPRGDQFAEVLITHCQIRMDGHMEQLKARGRKDLEALDCRAVRKIVLSLFRRRNDYGNFDVSSVIEELRKLGVKNVKQLRLLMKRHRRSILDEERRKMPRPETLYLLETFDRAGVDSHSNTSWFAVTGLVREAIGREFCCDEVFLQEEAEAESKAKAEAQIAEASRGKF